MRVLKYAGISQADWHKGQIFYQELPEGLIRVVLIDFAFAVLDLEHQQGTPLRGGDLRLANYVLSETGVEKSILDRLWIPPTELEY